MITGFVYYAHIFYITCRQQISLPASTSSGRKRECLPANYAAIFPDLLKLGISMKRLNSGRRGPYRLCQFKLKGPYRACQVQIARLPSGGL